MKNKNSTDSLLKKYTADIGIAIMTLATVVGMLELPEHSVNSRYILPGQPIRVNTDNLSTVVNPIRRDKEETNPEYISYSETQRTPSRSGKY